MRKAEAARRRRRTWLLWGAVGVIIAAIAAAVGINVANRSSSSSTTAAPSSSSSTLTGPPGPEGIVLEQGTALAPASAAADGATVGGIQCNTREQVAYHIHAHLAIFVNGVLRPVPGGIGVVEPVPQQTAEGPFDGASRCFYWMHTHAQDGIIHVEAPSQATYTLGQFFGVWRQQLSGNQIGSMTGKVTTYVNGKVFKGDPSSITLTDHEDIQLVLGHPTVAPKRIDWSTSRL